MSGYKEPSLNEVRNGGKGVWQKWMILIIFVCKKSKYADTGEEGRILVKFNGALYGWPLT